MSNDIVAIKQTLASYCHRVDHGTAEQVADLFAHDAILSPIMMASMKSMAATGSVGGTRFIIKRSLPGLRI